VGSRKARMLLALLAVEPHRLTASRRSSRHCGRCHRADRPGARVDLYDADCHVETALQLLRAGDGPPALATAVHALLVLESGGVLDGMTGADWAEPAARSIPSRCAGPDTSPRPQRCGRRTSNWPNG
jgi:hypothetical protein